MRNHSVLACAIGAVIAVVVAGQSMAHAGVLFASRAAGDTGELYTLSPATGAMVSDIGPLNDAGAVNYPITGLAFHPITGVLYGSTGNSESATAAKLVSINPATALVTVIGNFDAGPVNTSGTPSTMADIAFDSAGNLYGVGSIGGPQLYSINTTTGKATVIGSTGLTSTTGSGLAISSGGVFYGTPTASRFGIYDSTLGTYTNIANPAKPTGGGAYGALDIDENGVLYGLNVGSGSPPPTALATISPISAVTNVGSSLASLDAIAFQPIPEPGSVALVSASVVVTFLRRRK